MFDSYRENTLQYHPERCINCRRCSQVCPHGVFAKGESVAELVRPTGCVECGACALNCPVLAFVRPSFIKSAIEEAHKATIPVCIHLDHGSTLGHIMEAIQCGFTSVMIDASTLPLEQNIAICKKVVELAHAVNVSVEGELGTMGTTGPEAEAGAEEIIYVNPDDVEAFVQATGVDTLAVAIGTAHGIYPKNKKPELKLDLLKEINARVDIPLVLHGGSANPDEEIAMGAGSCCATTSATR